MDRISPANPGRTPLTPKGIGDFRRVKYLVRPCEKGRTPLTPKGIGDIVLPFFFCCLVFSGRTPLTPKGIGDCTATFDYPVQNKSWGERPSRRKALETIPSRISLANSLGWGERPSRRKALETGKLERAT